MRWRGAEGEWVRDRPGRGGAGGMKGARPGFGVGGFWVGGFWVSGFRVGGVWKGACEGGARLGRGREVAGGEAGEEVGEKLEQDEYLRGDGV